MKNLLLVLLLASTFSIQGCKTEDSSDKKLVQADPTPAPSPGNQPSPETPSGTPAPAPVEEVVTSSAVSLSTAEDTAALANLTGSSSTGNPVTYSILTPTTKGTASINPSTGVLNYSPSANYFGSDSLTYKVTSSTGKSSTSTVSITITPVNDLPVAAAVSKSVDFNLATELNLSATDVENDSVILTITQPNHGSITYVGGKYYFNPELGYSGPVTASYVAADSATGPSAPITITVNPKGATGSVDQGFGFAPSYAVKSVSSTLNCQPSGRGDLVQKYSKDRIGCLGFGGYFARVFGDLSLDALVKIDVSSLSSFHYINSFHSAFVDSSDRTVVLGYIFDSRDWYASASAQYLLRLNEDGSIDTSFGTSGFKKISAYSDSTTCKGQKIIAQGSKILMSCTKAGYNAIKRFNSDGTDDTTFNATGTVIIPQNPFGDSRTFVAQKDLIDSNGKVLAFIQTGNGSLAYVSVLQISNSGAIDSVAELNLGSSQGTAFYSAMKRPDGKIAVTMNDKSIWSSAYGSYGTDGITVVAQLSELGALEVQFPLSTCSRNPNVIGVDSQNRTLIQCQRSGLTIKEVVTRFNSSMALDTPWAINGELDITPNGAVDTPVFLGLLYGDSRMMFQFLPNLLNWQYQRLWY